MIGSRLGRSAVFDGLCDPPFCERPRRRRRNAAPSTRRRRREPTSTTATRTGAPTSKPTRRSRSPWCGSTSRPAPGWACSRRSASPPGRRSRSTWAASRRPRRRAATSSSSSRSSYGEDWRKYSQRYEIGLAGTAVSDAGGAGARRHDPRLAHQGRVPRRRRADGGLRRARRRRGLHPARQGAGPGRLPRGGRGAAHQRPHGPEDVWRLRGNRPVSEVTRRHRADEGHPKFDFHSRTRRPTGPSPRRRSAATASSGPRTSTGSC